MKLNLGSELMGSPVLWDGSPNLHLCITGDSGCGKSYLLKQLLPQAAMQGAKVIIFDTQGDLSEVDTIEFPDWGHCNSKLIDISDKHYHLDLFRPSISGEDPEDIAERLTGIFASALQLGESQRAMVSEFLFDGLSSGAYTSLSDLVEDIKECAAENETAQRLSPKLRSISRKIPSGPFPFPWDIDTSGILIVNLQSILDPKNQAILMELMASEIAGKKISLLPSAAVQRPPLIFVFDECQRLSMKSGTMVERILREGRKYGVYGWFSTQWIKKNELKPLGQAGIKIFFRTQTDAEALNSAVSQLGAQSSEKKKMYKRLLTRLKVGEFLVLQGQKIHHCRPGT